MGNNTSHYLGAYLKINIKKTDFIQSARVCGGGHRTPNGDFCPLCGQEIKTRVETIYRFPTLIYDHLLDDEKWEETLAEITPPKFFQTDTMIAISNISDHGWLSVDSDHGDTQVKIFPSGAEVEAMKKGLASNCKEIITALRQSDCVLSVTVEAGYVLNAEH